MASHPPMQRTFSCVRPPLAGVNAARLGSCVTPSASTSNPRPPETPRMLASKSSSSSKIADQFRALKVVGSPPLKSTCCGTVLLGPAPKIQTTLSLRPKGWHEEQDPQPAFDIRPVIADCPAAGGSNSPMDGWYSSLPIC